MQIQEQRKFINEDGGIYIIISNREWEYSRKTKDKRRREKLWCHCTVAARTKDIWKQFIWEKERKKRKVWDDTCSCLWPYIFNSLMWNKDQYPLRMELERRRGMLKFDAKDHQLVHTFYNLKTRQTEVCEYIYNHN